MTIGIFLDLSKTFETLNHNIFLQKLKFYDFNRTAITLTESYLNDHKQFFQKDDTMSDFSVVITGVPQGSILGPYCS